LVRRAGTDAARLAPAVHRLCGHGRSHDRAAPRRRLHDPRHDRRRRHLRPRAPEHGAQRDRVHGPRPHRPAGRADQRHRRLAGDAREARTAAVTLWARRVETTLAPEVWSFLRADDAELLPYDLEATLLHAQRLHAAGILDDAELAGVPTKLGTI